MKHQSDHSAIPLLNQKKKILLAEDDNAIRRYIEVILEREGFEVISAKDGIAAMEAAFSNEIDALVTDAMMPNMNGLDLCRLLRQDPDKKEVFCIMMSGLDEKAQSNDSNIIDKFLLKGSNLKYELLSALSGLFSDGNCEPLDQYPYHLPESHSLHTAIR